MEKLKCLNCGRTFERRNAPGKKPRFCSWDCKQKYTREDRNAYAREYYHQLYGKRKRRQKTYDEIQAYNRKHPIPEGWRGQSPFWGYVQP